MSLRVIALEGTDASGKETQAKRLVENLRALGHDAEMVSFPRYENESSVFVRKYLSGAYGDDPKEIDPYTAALFFALDRFDYFKGEELPEILVVDRYTISNMIHQASKFDSELEREAFNDWLEDFEYKNLKIPEPDLILFLDMPTEMSQKLMTGREGKDIHEKDRDYQKNAHDYAKKLAEEKNWEIISCTDGEKLLSVEEIEREILNRVKKLDV